MGLTLLEGFLSSGNFVLIYVVIDGLYSERLEFTQILTLTGILAILYLLRLFVFCTGYIQGLIGGAEVSKQARIAIGDKLKRVPLALFSKRQIGQYISIATTDVNDYEKILTHKSGDLVKNFALLFMTILFAGVIWTPGGFLLLSIPVLLIPSIPLSTAIIKKWGGRKREANAENVSSTVEYISGLQTYRVYGMSGTKNKSTIDAMRKYSEVCYHYESVGIPFGVLYMMLSWLVLPSMLWIAYTPWSTGELSTVSYLLLCLLPLFLSKLSNTIYTDLVSYKNLSLAKKKIEDIMKMPEEPEETQPFSTDTHEIALEHIYFRYTEQVSVLEDVSFFAPDGKLTAIVGDSGSGKSTILNLIAKYYEPQSGCVMIGGRNTKPFSAEGVLGEISVVDQDVFLFNDTVRNNIRYTKPNATDEEVEAACRAANCDGFIKKMEDGYDTLIGENGKRLSGGERQRLSIARAILKNSPILLLDEATASLDIENELAVKQAISNLLKAKKTVVMIAHTLSIVKNADQILVVSDGRIVESGTHEELLRKGGKYAVMWNAEQQLSA